MERQRELDRLRLIFLSWRMFLKKSFTLVDLPMSIHSAIHSPSKGLIQRAAQTGESHSTVISPSPAQNHQSSPSGLHVGKYLCSRSLRGFLDFFKNCTQLFNIVKISIHFPLSLNRQTGKILNKVDMFCVCVCIKIQSIPGDIRGKGNTGNGT